MAITKIWDVNDSLSRVITYACNDEKTEDDSMEIGVGEYDSLKSVVSYTTNNLKTHKQLYVSTLNCDIDTIYEEMNLTKEAYQKTDGILAFHAIQSFAPNEVTAENSHKIGVELADKLWGDRFQVLVTTHLDKEHYHNHFVINSVSFKDGLRYYDNKKSYKLMRTISDTLCEKYKLSIIKNPKKKGYHYAEWKAEEEGIRTWRSIIRDDVDDAINNARTYNQFLSNLKQMGYVVKSNVKHIAVKPQGKDRFIRLRSLSFGKGQLYDEDSIRQRILRNKIFVDRGNSNIQINQGVRKVNKLKGFKALYYYYMYLMGVIPEKKASNKRVHFLFKEDLRYLDQITKEVTIMEKKNIDNVSELDIEISKVESSLESLTKERRCIYNKVRRCKNEEMKDLLKKDIKFLSRQIKEFRKEVRLYEGIKERSTKMEQKINDVQEQTEKKEVTENECRRRNGRSSR